MGRFGTPVLAVAVGIVLGAGIVLGMDRVQARQFTPIVPVPPSIVLR